MSEIPLRRRIPPKSIDDLTAELLNDTSISQYDALALATEMHTNAMEEIYKLARLGEEVSGELAALKQWQLDAAEELADIRSQWGDEYLWWKHNEKPVCELLRRAGYHVQEKEKP